MEKGPVQIVDKLMLADTNQNGVVNAVSTLGEIVLAKKVKQQRKNNPEVVRVTQEIYSVKTSRKDDRCFVIKEGANTICLHRDCKQLHATYPLVGNLKD